MEKLVIINKKCVNYKEQIDNQNRKYILSIPTLIVLV
jgi:hypothetical protein